MNFLSHYYFERENSSHYQVLGMVMPDFIKHANSRWNAHPQKYPDKFVDFESLRQILSGWERHLLVDKIFHSSPFFIQQTQLLKVDLIPILVNTPVRPSFLAHISLELLLDHLLVVNDKIMVNRFYEQLEQCILADILEFLKRSGIADGTAFSLFFERFLQSKYLHSYDKIENTGFALLQICKRLWADPFDIKVRDLLVSVLELHKMRLEDDFMIIFDQIDESLKLYA